MRRGVFTEALRKGWETYFASLADPETLSSIKLTLIAADLVNEALLRQSAFSPADRYCSAERQSEIAFLSSGFSVGRMP